MEARDDRVKLRLSFWYIREEYVAANRYVRPGRPKLDARHSVLSPIESVEMGKGSFGPEPGRRCVCCEST